MKNHWWKLPVAVIVSEAAGIVGAIFTAPAIPVWYAGLEKSALTPPSWVFAPVWTTLYLLMGVAAYFVWKSGFAGEARTALEIFAIQLVLNMSWSAVFFGLESPLGGLFVIAALWLAIVWTIAAFRDVSKLAAYLLIPYLVWTSFAAYLNFAIWFLNR